MDSIIKSFLRDNNTFRESLLPQKNPKKLRQNSLHTFYDNQFYNKYDWKVFNEQKMILFKKSPSEKKEEVEEQLKLSLKNCREMSQIASKLRNMLTIPNVLQKSIKNPIKLQKPRSNRREALYTVETDEKVKESLEINSFFSNESTFVKNTGTSFLSLKSLKAQSSEGRKKDLRLLSKRFYKEFSQ